MNSRVLVALLAVLATVCLVGHAVATVQHDARNDMVAWMRMPQEKG